jgi:putative FmdB family regulatory protein
MPIYEYKCEDCGTKFEKLVRNSNLPELACPSCGKNHLQQEYSTFAPRASAGKSSDAPMCPSGGPCGNPGMCGLN